jgi:transposase
MSRQQKHPLRALTDDEHSWLRKIARSKREPASHVARAKQLLAAADGHSYTAAAKASGRKSGDAVAQLVERFNREGVQAVEPQRGGGPKPKYGARERQRILAEVRRTPDPEQDGTATWSLMLLRRALRRAADGLPGVSAYTIHAVLQEAGFSWPRTRSWCETGVSKRKRKNGEVVKVVDPDAEPKKS